MASNRSASPGTHEYYEYACLLLLVADKGRYRGLIHTLAEQVDKTKEPRLAYELARACIITPEMTADPDESSGGHDWRWIALPCLA